MELKKNGRALFYNSETNDYIYTKKIIAQTNALNFESEFIKIKLYNDEEKDYFLSCTNSDFSIEITDFESEETKGIRQGQVFGHYIWRSRYFSILDLKNEKNIYMFCYIAIENEKNYIVLQKIKFFNWDLSQSGSYEMTKSTEIKEELLASSSEIISCIDFSNVNIVQCFYISINKYYTISLFNLETLDLISSNIIDKTLVNIYDYPFNHFFGSIFLKNEVSAIVYMLENEPPFFYIQIKEIKERNSKYELENYFLKKEKIIINENRYYYFDPYFPLTDFRRITDDKFCLISSGLYVFDLYIFIFEFYNFHDLNLCIRYYHIPLKLYNLKGQLYLKGFEFNRYLGLIITNDNFRQNKVEQNFFIFSYIGGIDSELITLDGNTVININNFINKDHIENNLFGVNLYGIKIIKLPFIEGIFYYSEKNNNIIYENDILPSDDIIHFIYDYDKLINLDNSIKYTIEMAGVLQEPSFSEFNKYPEYIENYGTGTQESYYKPKIYIGKSIFYNFTFPSTTLSGTNNNICATNKPYCKICYNENTCINCDNNFFLKEDTNICESNLNDGYYLNNNYKTHRKCHENCSTCLNGPIFYNDILEYEDTNCENCKENYYKIENTNNCIKKDDISFGYYFNSDKNVISKCYKNCMTCSSSETDSTLFNCLTCDENMKFYEKSKNCLDCVLRGKYVNYEQNDCINEIPDGYYLLNEEYKTIDSCYISCKKCETKGDENDHKCNECSEDYPYNYKNIKCLDDCSKENLFLDEIDKKCYDNCSDNESERKYGYKNKCYRLEDLPTEPLITEVSDSNTDILTKISDSNTDILTEKISASYINIKTENDLITEKISDAFTNTFTNQITDILSDSISNTKLTNIMEDSVIDKNTDSTKSSISDSNIDSISDLNKIKMTNSITDFIKDSTTDYYLSNKISDSIINKQTNAFQDSISDLTKDITTQINDNKNSEIITDTSKETLISTQSDFTTEKHEENEPKIPLINDNINCNNLYYIIENKKICIDNKICPNDYPYIKIGSKECSNCPVTYNRKCFLKCPEDTCIDQNNGNLDICINKKEGTEVISDLCFENFPAILSNIEDLNINTNKVITNNPLVTINMYQNEININDAKNKNPNLTFIDLGECTEKLKQYYHLPPNEKFYIVSLDITNKISNQPINSTNFKIYLANKTLIEDLSACDGVHISISIPITDLEAVNFNEAEIFNLQGYDIYNLSSEFYNEKCTSANINGNDIILFDRKTDIYPQGISFCPNGCELNLAELQYKRFNCSCSLSSYESGIPTKVEEETQTNVQTDDNYFVYLLDMLNYKIFGCHNILSKSNFSDYFNNIGFYIGLVVTLFNLISFFIFFCCFLSQFRVLIAKHIPHDIKLKNKMNELKKNKNNVYSNPVKKGRNSISIIKGVSNKKRESLKIKNNKKDNEENNNNKKGKKKKIENNNYIDIKSRNTDDFFKSNKKIIKKSPRTKKNKKKKLSNLLIEEKYILKSKESKMKLDSEYNNKNDTKISIIKEEDKIDERDLDEAPYTVALRTDKRNFIIMFLCIIKMRIDIIPLLFYPEEYTHRSLTLSIYVLDFLFSYFMNALLYSDDVVSQKYHNNGSLDLITSLSLSLISNIVSSLAIWIIKRLTNYNQYLLILINDVYRELPFLYMFKKIYKYIKIKIFIFFSLSFIACVSMTYYLFVFCQVYEKSQVSLLTNYFLGIVESLITLVATSLIISILRFISLKCKYKNIYRTSVYINSTF